MDYNEVNKRILELCEQRNWSEYKLAQKANIPNSSINAMLKHNHVPTIYNLEKICNAFEITLSQFFDSKLFNKQDNTELYIQLWRDLHESEKQLVITYMHGLLKRPIDTHQKEGYNDL